MLRTEASVLGNYSPAIPPLIPLWTAIHKDGLNGEGLAYLHLITDHVPGRMHCGICMEMFPNSMPYEVWANVDPMPICQTMYCLQITAIWSSKLFQLMQANCPQITHISLILLTRTS